MALHPSRMVEVPERQPYVRWTTTYYDFEEMIALPSFFLRFSLPFCFCASPPFVFASFSSSASPLHFLFFRYTPSPASSSVFSSPFFLCSCHPFVSLPLPSLCFFSSTSTPSLPPRLQPKLGIKRGQPLWIRELSTAGSTVRQQTMSTPEEQMTMAVQQLYVRLQQFQETLATILQAARNELV